MDINIIRESATAYGVQTLNGSELLCILLGEKPVRSLRQEFGDDVRKILEGISSVEPRNLKQLDGITDNVIMKLRAMEEVSRRRIKEVEVGRKISNPKDAYNYFNDMQFLPNEHLKVLFLNTKNVVIGIRDIHSGGMKSSIVDPMVIFKEALLMGSTCIIVAHNHPSGSTEPSGEDINVTTRLRKAGSIIGVEVLDHLIIGENQFYSFREEGKI